MMIPLPAVTPITAPFWEACKRGVLQIQRCLNCGHKTLPPDVACNRCLSPGVVWTPCSGLGTVKSFSIVHRASQPVFKVPYIVAIVQLDGGCALFTNLIHCDPDQVKIGMKVKVEFVSMSAEITLPYFAPD